MTVFAVTGHMDLTRESEILIREAMKDLLRSHASQSLHGVSCIARGADTIFAEVILEIGGTLTVILPSRDYRKAKVKPDHAPVFDQLLTSAAEIHIMNYETANQTAYEAANAELLKRADHLVAIWDGAPALGKGGTADTVLLARQNGLPVHVIWPEGAGRESK